jgi:uncharacterized protein DUF3489
MKHFTIENETNNITVHATAKAAEAVPDAERFNSEAGLAKLAANWPAARLVEIYNSLPGETAVKKFKDRATATNRIWKALQSFAETAPVVTEVADPEAQTEAAEAPAPEPTVPETPFDPPVSAQSPDVAPEAAPSTNKATRTKKASKAAKSGPREGSKTDAILALMKQPSGTTLKAIMEATNWQAHSVRGFISGTLNKKMGLTVASTKSESGERTYSISA